MNHLRQFACEHSLKDSMVNVSQNELERIFNAVARSCGTNSKYIIGVAADRATRILNYAMTHQARSAAAVKISTDLILKFDHMNTYSKSSRNFPAPAHLAYTDCVEFENRDARRAATPII